MARETLWECLTKRFENDISEDLDHSTNSSDSNGSLPRKRLRRLLEFKTPKELAELKYVAGEVLELKDYAKWFMSRSEANVDDILDIENYGEWLSTLGTEAKANVILDGYNFCEWLAKGTERNRWDETESSKHMNKRYGELALAHFNATRDSTQDYEYTGRCACDLLKFEEFIHLNFYARLKVSESRSEPGPEQLFFAEVDSENKVTLCCILDSEKYVNSDVRHPPGFECLECMEFD